MCSLSPCGMLLLQTSDFQSGLNGAVASCWAPAPSLSLSDHLGVCCFHQLSRIQALLLLLSLTTLVLEPLPCLQTCACEHLNEPVSILCLETLCDSHLSPGRSQRPPHCAAELGLSRPCSCLPFFLILASFPLPRHAGYCAAFVLCVASAWSFLP